MSNRITIVQQDNGFLVTYEHWTTTTRVYESTTELLEWLGYVLPKYEKEKKK